MAYFEFTTNQMYVQGEGALYEIKRYCYPLGSKFLIIMGCGPLTGKVTEIIKKSFDNTMESNVQEINPKYSAALKQAQRYDNENKTVEYFFADYEGKQTTFERIDEVAAIVREKDIDVIIGVGGGKALDFARGAHHKTGAKVVLVPTAGATNAPATALNVIYSEEGLVEAMWRMDGFPQVVIADTSLLVTAPPKTLVAGIGDCICTCYETIVNIKQKALEGKVVDNALMAVEAQREIFYKEGYLAVKAMETQTITHAFESVMAIILNMSGPYRSLVNMSIGHCYDEFLLEFEPCHKLPHGFIVGYAVIPMLVYANFDIEEIYKYIDFAMSIGLPVNREQLGIADVSNEELERVAEITANNATGAAAMSGSKFTKDDFWKNILIADKLVNDYIQ
ncbi:MAG: iron-containing alcohol dehydrogenase [Clostridiaceae bacterium]